MELMGATIMVKTLTDLGVDTIFGYPGGAVLPLYDEIFKQNHIRHILVRHEQGATHAAEGYARSTGKVGVVLVTSGPGATNTVTGLTDALLDSIPILCIAGQVPTHLIGSDAFQEADTVGITRSATKHNYLIKQTKDIARITREAYYIARTGRPGPVLIDLPKDVQLGKAEYDNKVADIYRRSYRPYQKVDKAAVEKAVALIAKSKRPVFYAGGGVINAGEKACALLTQFVRMTGAPVTNTLMGLGAYPASDPQFLQMLGMHGSYEANMAMAHCDVMVNIGARFDDRITGRVNAFSTGSKKIHVDVDASSINKNIKVDVPVVGNAEDVLKEMIDVWKKKKYKLDAKALKSWWKQVDEWRKVPSFKYDQSGDIVKPQYVLDRLNTLLHKEKDFFITTDVGQHQMWAAQFLKFDRPNRWMTSGGLGTMGYGLPAALGVQIAHPKKTVVCVTGEASLMMNMQEFSTIVQYRLPVKICILNNRYMGMVRQWQQMFHGDRHSESYMDALPDFVKLGEAFGIKAIRCEKPKSVDDMLKLMLSHDGPVIADMVVDQNENVYPMIAAGAAHYEMILGPDQDVNSIKVDKAEAAKRV